MVKQTAANTQSVIYQSAYACGLARRSLMAYLGQSWQTCALRCCCGSVCQLFAVLTPSGCYSAGLSLQASDALLSCQFYLVDVYDNEVFVEGYLHAVGQINLIFVVALFKLQHLYSRIVGFQVACYFAGMSFAGTAESLQSISFQLPFLSNSTF